MNNVLFIQKRARRAGAQVSLSRIVNSSEITPLHPCVLLGEEGWLDGFLTEKSIPHHISPWPSPRSLGARIGGLKKFAENTLSQLHTDGIAPIAIVANDHQETLPALALAKAAGGVPVAVILRTPGMTENDFNKYRCGECDLIFARGEQLTHRASSWSGKEVACMSGSFSDEDFYPPLPKTTNFPPKILVAGSEEPRKGFSDFIEALKIVEASEPDFPAMECVLTGDQNEELTHLIDHGFRSTFKFVGRVDKFPDFARQFQLAIHPSRSESFGMAPLELLLAGVPTMISLTGITSSLPLSSPWVFSPESPSQIASSLMTLWKNWESHRLDLSPTQQHIRDQYHISQTSKSLAQKITKLTSA